MVAERNQFVPVASGAVHDVSHSCVLLQFTQSCLHCVLHASVVGTGYLPHRFKVILYLPARVKLQYMLTVRRATFISATKSGQLFASGHALCTLCLTVIFGDDWSSVLYFSPFCLITLQSHSSTCFYTNCMMLTHAFCKLLKHLVNRCPSSSISSSSRVHPVWTENGNPTLGPRYDWHVIEWYSGCVLCDHPLDECSCKLMVQQMPRTQLKIGIIYIVLVHFSIHTTALYNEGSTGYLHSDTASLEGGKLRRPATRGLKLPNRWTTVLVLGTYRLYLLGLLFLPSEGVKDLLLLSQQ